MADMSLPNEQWRAIPGYEGCYEVSDQGRVRSLSRTVVSSEGKRIPIRERILRPSQFVSGDKGAYRRVVLCKDGATKNFTVHILVMAAFVGSRPPGAVICHGNGDGTDNRLSNLRYDSLTANMADALRHGTNSNANKTHCPRNHPYDEANTYFTRKGARQCRTCRKAAQRASDERKRARAAAVMAG